MLVWTRVVASEDKLGPYVLGERLGAGGMGEVYLAHHVGIAGFRRQVAIKRVRSPPDDALIDRFIDEARIAALLVHPNIVSVYDFGRDGDGFYLVMEYVDGGSLASVLAGGAALSRELAVHIVAEVARAADHAYRARDLEGHPLRVVHRDISPHNVLLSRAGDVKLADFGIARAERQLSRTATGSVLGKVAYMSPEQLAGRPVDGRADVFALGVMLWELTIGVAAFPATAARRAEHAVLPPPCAIDPEYPLALEAIAMAALADDPDARTATSGELARALDSFLDQRGVRVRREEVAALVPARRPPSGAQRLTGSAPGPSEPPTRRYVRALRVGDAVGDYEITGIVGEGGMGVVYAAVDRRIGKRVAIKVLRRQPGPGGGDARAVERFLHEARAVNRIGHPNIVDIFGFGALPGGGVYCVMELLSGATLREVLGDRAPLSPRAALDLLRPVAAAIDAGHRAGVVHCDLKPDTIFVCERGDGSRAVKVLDFGLARITDAALSAGDRGAPLGTPLYMAPEQCRGERGDHRIDVYALGVILYQAITGRLPFGDMPPFAILAAHIAAEPTPPSQHGAPASADAAILRCLAKQPADRFDSLGAALDGFEAATRGPGSRDSPDPSERPAAPEPPTVQPPRMRPRAARWLAGAALAAVAAAAAVVAVAVAGRGSPSAPNAPNMVEPKIVEPNTIAPDAASAVLDGERVAAPAPSVAEEAGPPHKPARRPARSAPPPPSPLDQRLLPESRDRLGAKLVSECARGGVVLPASVAFKLRVDKLGRPFDAELVSPADLAGAPAACLRRWMNNWRFLAADGETSGRLEVALPRAR
jgi:serine/threonine protein kinase